VPIRYILVLVCCTDQAAVAYWLRAGRTCQSYLGKSRSHCTVDIWCWIWTASERLQAYTSVVCYTCMQYYNTLQLQPPSILPSGDSTLQVVLTVMRTTLSRNHVAGLQPTRRAPYVIPYMSECQSALYTTNHY
jgi:hypothetical protein